MRLNKGKPFRPSPAPDFITFRRKRRTSSLTVNPTHNACQGMIARCGHRSGDCAPRAIMAKGALHGENIAAISAGRPGRLTATSSEERRGGKDVVRKCSSRWALVPEKEKQ